MANTIKVDFKLGKYANDEERGDRKIVSFIAPSEKKSIFHQLQLFVEERIDYYDERQKEVRIEVPLGINTLGEYKSPTIWSSIIFDMVDFSKLYPSYFFGLKVSVDGFSDYYLFEDGWNKSITRGEFNYLISKRYYYFMCANQKDVADGKNCSIEQLVISTPRGVLIKENFKEFVQFGLNLFDSDEDYYASNLIYSAYYKYHADGYQYQAFKLTGDKKSKRLDIQAYSIEKVKKNLEALKYSYQQEKFHAHLEQYSLKQRQVLKDYYEQLLALTQYAVENELVVIMVLIPESLDLAIFENKR